MFTFKIKNYLEGTDGNEYCFLVTGNSLNNDGITQLGGMVKPYSDNYQYELYAGQIVTTGKDNNQVYIILVANFDEEDKPSLYLKYIGEIDEINTSVAREFYQSVLNKTCLRNLVWKPMIDKHNNFITEDGQITYQQFPYWENNISRKVNNPFHFYLTYKTVRLSVIETGPTYMTSLLYKIKKQLEESKELDKLEILDFINKQPRGTR